VKKLIIVSFASIALLTSCQDNSPSRSTPPPVTTRPPVVTPPPVTPPATNPLDDLPKDMGGVHKPVALGADNSPYGYYLYTPSGYSRNGPRFPLLVFLHGSGQIGNSKDNPSALDSVLHEGPPHLILKGAWAPKYPMIVASAQCHEGPWDTFKVKEFVEFIRSSYQVDTLRIYLTGLSMGGSGTFDQLTVYGGNSHLAAAVSISGGGELTADKATKAAQVPLWSFNGENDQNVLPDFSKALVKAINELSPVVPAKITMYPQVGHDAWTETYDGTGMGREDPAYDPFKMDIYSWMLQFSKK
jgi:predicted peptidase